MMPIIFSIPHVTEGFVIDEISANWGIFSVKQPPQRFLEEMVGLDQGNVVGRKRKCVFFLVSPPYPV